MDSDAQLASRFVNASTSVCSIRGNAAGIVLACNPAFLRSVQADASAVIGRPLSGWMTAIDAQRLLEQVAARSAPRDRQLLNFTNGKQHVFTLSSLVQVSDAGFELLGESTDHAYASAQDELLRLTNELSVLHRESERRGKELAEAKAELERTLTELHASYWHLKKIQEFLPICMRCGKVKTGEARWENVAEYLKKNSLFLTHGYCPDCFQDVKSAARSRRSILPREGSTHEQG